MDITLFKSEGRLFLKKIGSRNDLGDFNVDGFLIDSEEKEIRRIIDVLKAKKEKKILAVVARDEEFNRRALETMKINLLVSPEYDPNKDSLKQRASGINHVLAKISAKNKIPIVINFSEFNKIQNKKEKAKILARIIQNVEVCRKAKADIKIATFAEDKGQLREDRELKSFLFSIGASSQQTTNATNF